MDLPFGALGPSSPVVHWVNINESRYGELRSAIEASGWQQRVYPAPQDFLSRCTGGTRECLVAGYEGSGMTGASFLRQLNERGRRIPAIFFISDPDVAAAVEAIKLGAFHVFHPPVAPEVFIERIGAALAIGSTTALSMDDAEGVRSRVLTLSDRERTLLAMLVSGQSSKQIAWNLHISVRTVSNHRAHILAKMKAANTADLIRMAMVASGRGAE